MNKLRLSVPRLSRLQYLTAAICEHGSKAQVEFDQLYQTVKRKGFEIEKERIRSSGIYRDITKEQMSSCYAEKLRRQTKETIRLMKRWNLIEALKDKEGIFRFRLDQSSFTDMVKAPDETTLRRKLYEQALHSGESLIFPSKYLMVLRNITTNGLGGVAYNERFREDLGKATFGRPVNRITMDVLNDWMTFFQVSDVFEAPSGVQEVVLSKAIASLREIQDLAETSQKTSSHIDKLLREYRTAEKKSEFAARSVLECTLHLGLLRTQKDDRLVYTPDLSSKDMYANLLGKNGWVISESDNFAETLDAVPFDRPERCFICVDFKIDLQSFFHTLVEKVEKNISAEYEYVWTDRIRREVCETAHVHSTVFDDYLRQIYQKYGPGLIETAAIYAETMAAKKIKAVPLIIDGRPIYKFRLRRKHL